LSVALDVNEMCENFQIAVLISGRGSNFKTIRDSAKSYKIAKVFSNKAKAPGLQFAFEANIAAESFPRKEYSCLLDQKNAIYDAIYNLTPDLVVMAGFMQILEADFVKRFHGKIINIHPSLLPAYRGLDTHRRVLEAKEDIHGCTVHFVDTNVDTGPIIAQASCPCFSKDTEDTLATRVLKEEHKLYPWVVNSIAKGWISLQHDRIQYSEDAVNDARQLGFLLNLEDRN